MAESRQAPGLGTSPFLCGWPATACLSLPEDMENHREVPTTPTCCPVLRFHLGRGQCLPSFWGIPRFQVGEVLLSSEVMGTGWGKPLSWGRGSSGSPGQAAHRVALLSIGYRPALSPAGPKWQKPPSLGTWGGPLTQSWGPGLLAGAQGCLTAKGWAAVGARPLTHHVCFLQCSSQEFTQQESRRS